MGTQVGETTLDLDQIMDEGMARFQGELEEAAREDLSSEQGARSSEEKAITPKPDETDDSPPEGQGSEVGGRRSDVGERKAGDEGPKTEKEGAEPKEGEAPLSGEQGARSSEEEKPKLRFKDHTEAEEGYRHLQAAKTRAEQEAARLRAELKTAQDAEQQRKEQEKRDRDMVDFMAEQHEQALDKIDELDPDAENYRKQVARVWAEKDAAIEVKRRELEAGGRERGAGSKEQGEEARAEDPAAAWAAAEEAARNAKLDPEDDYFRMICTFAPAQGADGQPLSFEAQVQWAVDETLAYHKKQEQRFQERLKKEAERQSEAHQEKNLPLGRSPADRSAGKPPAPKVVTLNDAIEFVMEERRL